MLKISESVLKFQQRLTESFDYGKKQGIMFVGWNEYKKAIIESHKSSSMYGKLKILKIDFVETRFDEWGTQHIYNLTLQEDPHMKSCKAIVYIKSDKKGCEVSAQTSYNQA